MSSCTDPLGLNDRKLFKDLKACLVKGPKETRNILEIRDDILFIWNAERGCILTQNINATRSRNHDVPYQILQPTDPPLFEVSHLAINETASQIAIWGDLGIVILELPKRWGKESKFQGGKEIISCLAHSLDMNSTTAEIRKARWHPGSSTDSHLVVLTSENIFQLYDCEMGCDAKLIRTWRVGPSIRSPAKIPNFAALGDAAVDFDFATPTIKHEVHGDDEINVNKVNWNQVEWPILVLRGNGDVLIVRGNVLVGNLTKPVVFGTLSMYPQTVDNYGEDSCSIMCLATTPPIVVIASCSGKLYHAVLLTEAFENEDKKSWSEYGSTYSLHTPDEALYVYECVELELGLFYTDVDKKYKCPIHLHADIGNRSRYFCSHNAGIHLINVPMAHQLQEYINVNDESIDLHLPSLNKQSSAHYLVSTRTKYTEKEEDTPILGFGLLQEPCILIALLHTGVVVDLTVVDSYYIPKIETTEPTASPSRKITREDFVSHIKNLLTREASQPITKLGLGNNLTPQQCLELLYHATTMFRKQHFIHHDKVRDEFRKKVKSLKTLKNHNMVELYCLMEMKKELQEKAETLAEKYEDIKDKQEELVKRSEEALRIVIIKEPSMTSAEREQARELKTLSEKVKELNVRIEQLKKKKIANQKLLSNMNERPEEKSIVILKDSQMKSISETLNQMSTDISTLINRVKALENEVGLK